MNPDRAQPGEQPPVDKAADAVDSSHHEDSRSTFLVSRDGQFADTSRPAAERSPDRSSREPLPEAFGRYRVLRVLGQGGMGCVYLGHDDQLDRPVAIKVPHPDLFQSETGHESYLKEARALAQFDHPGIIAVFDAGQTTKGTCYVVFKYVAGETLKDRLKQSRIPPERAAEIIAQIADALHHAHKLGFVHRDIKPSNILIDETGKPWVADFGLAVAESAQRKLAGEVSGTPAYMPPEQTRGEVSQLDGRSDLWSVGVMLYEMLTGRKPFVATTVPELFEDIAQKEARPLRMIDETIPAELERITLKCLRKAVTERYSTAHDLALDLRRWSRNCIRFPLKLALFAGSAVVVLIFVIVVLKFNRPSSSETVRQTLDPATPTVPEPDRTKELALLVEEMRGLRRDLGESSSRSVREVNSSDAASASSNKTELELPNPAGIPFSGDWTPIPLPAGYGELESGLFEARSKGNEKEESRLLLKATNQLIDDAHYRIAEHLAYRMVELAGNDPSDVPFAYGQLGLAQFRLGKSEEALASYRRSEETYQRLYDRMMKLPDSEQVLQFRSHLARLLGMTVMRIGNVHAEGDNYQLAKIAFEKSKLLYETHQRQEELATLLLNYGGLESKQGNYEQAIALLNEGLALTQSQNKTEAEAEFRVNLGNAYARNDDNASALEQYRLAYQSITPESDYRLRSALLGNFGTSLIEEGQHAEARERLLELQSIVRPEDTEAQRVLEFLPALDNLRPLPKNNSTET